MAKVPENRKVTLKPGSKAKIDIKETSLFSKKVDPNMWESVQDKLTAKSKSDQSNVQAEMFKIEQQAQRFGELVANPNGKKINFSC